MLWLTILENTLDFLCFGLFPPSPNPNPNPFDSPAHQFSPPHTPKTIGIPNAIITLTVTVSVFVLIILIILALAAIAFEDPQIGLLLVDPNHLSQVSIFYPYDL
ncbi:hypothetical protein L1987_66781 [Smallanthus sonchifolius]|uniref:Uncharacterized protein n=1 Tax=Smallanthus sonchifolius TaxID=185202 RepID=A0ACB9BY93_9ASTR|nr:hypothetical protein L1987_66781 [Smallanthus sonchifolius]